MKRLALLALAAAAAGCAGTLSLGAHKDGYAVEARGATPDEARRAALAQLVPLFVGDLKAARPVLDKELYPKAASFIVREKDGRFLVDLGRLGKALDRLKLVRPDGVRGKPGVLVSLRESGPGAGRESGVGAGRAGDTLRRRLVERGYEAADFADALTGAQRTGSPEEALAAARKAGVPVAVTGTADAAALADKRLEGYASCGARLQAAAWRVDGKGSLGEAAVRADAVDVSSEAACAKALENAGELGADRLAAGLARTYPERHEFTVILDGFGGADRAKAFVDAVRAQPRFSGGALEAVSGKDCRFKIWAEHMSADELTAQLLALKEFRLEVRQVDNDFNTVEFGHEGEFY